MTPQSRDEARDRLAAALVHRLVKFAKAVETASQRERIGLLLDHAHEAADAILALLSPEGQGAPVAWRVKDFADGWILFNSEAAAKHEADAMGGALMQSLVPAPPTKGGE